MVIVRTNNNTCPYTFLQTYVHMANIKKTDEYMFRNLTYFKSSNIYELRNDNVGITYSTARTVLEKLTFWGLDVTNYCLISLRSGGATVNANAGVTDRMFKMHGIGNLKKDSVESMLKVSISLGL